MRQLDRTDDVASADGADAPDSSAQRRRRRKLAVFAGRVVLVAVLFVTWELVSEYEIVDPFFISRPSGIFDPSGPTSTQSTSVRTKQSSQE